MHCPIGGLGGRFKLRFIPERNHAMRFRWCHVNSFAATILLSFTLLVGGAVGYR